MKFINNLEKLFIKWMNLNRSMTPIKKAILHNTSSGTLPKNLIKGTDKEELIIKFIIKFTPFQCLSK